MNLIILFDSNIATPEDTLDSGIPNASAGTGNMGEEGRVPAGCGWVRGRSRQRVALPLHLLPERRR